LETTSSDEDGIEDCNNDDKWETNSDEKGIEDYPYSCIDEIDDSGYNPLSDLDDLVSRLHPSVFRLLPSSVREQMLQDSEAFVAKIMMDFEGDSSNNDEELEITSSDEDDIKDCNNDDDWETNSDEDGIEDYPYHSINDIDDRGYNTALDLDDLVLEAFKTGEQYKLPSSIREHMMQEQSEYLSEVVTFYRPDRSTEMKNIMWCLDQEFLEVEEGLWSGGWFFDSKKEWDDAVIENCWRQDNERKIHIARLQKSAKVLSASDFEEILKLKANGNSLFVSKKYKEAIGQYNKALDLFPLSIGPVPTKQLDEHVNILSNKAESLLRLKKYREAQMTATEAILLDSNHVKSLLRRAKATFRGAEYDSTGINPFVVGRSLEDLEEIMALGGEAAVEAEKFKIEIECSLKNDDNLLASKMFESMCGIGSKPT